MPNLPMMTKQQVVDSYRGSKQKLYQIALESLQMESLKEADARLASFTKFEKVDVSKAPRAINPRNPRYNLELGRYLKHAEHHFFRAINKAFGSRTRATVIKGYNADASAQILHSKMDVFDRPVAIGIDAEKFDMHVSVRALLYEHSFYKLLFPRSSKLRRLLKWQLRNKGCAYTKDGFVEFMMEGTRSSGDLNTSLGNCILMCAMIWAYARSLGIDIELANNGDDCVVFMEARDAERFRLNLSRWFQVRGFGMTVEATVTEFEQIEFCQTHPVELSSGWRMVRNMKAVMEKDPMCLLPIPNSNVLRKWLDAVGTCGGVLSSGVPVHSNFYAVMTRNGINSGKLIEEVFKGRSQLQLAAGCAQAEVTDESRVSYYYAFGVLPDEQIALERYYDKLLLSVELSVAVDRDALTLNPGTNILSIVQQ
jgi:hypothetical protein